MTGYAKSGGNAGFLRPGTQESSIADVVRRWPRERPLAVVCGGGPAWSTTLFGAPGAALIVDENGSRWRAGGEGAPFRLGHGAMEDLRAALAWGRGRGGGWVAYLSYELGEAIEPAARRKQSRPGPWPLIALHRCETVLAFDHNHRRWSGEIPEGAARSAAWRVGDLRSETGQSRFEAAVDRAIEYIRAGDVYQVNLAHRLVAMFSGSTRGAFAALLEGATPWHGAYMEGLGDVGGDGGGGGHEVGDGGVERGALLSASPELFLKVEGQRITTRPMKGTSPANRDASELRESGKDLAELNMIIDLMRNDLGRVCRFGTVKVEEARAIERHGSAAARSPGVWQGVGTVVGELRDGLDLVDLLAAAFPAGSVTGAPKIRAMQIIDELELSDRGPYCGSIGWIGDDGRMCLNVAIRTACVRGRGARAGALDEIVDGEVSFSVGAGIVAESVARREWEETLAKAGVMGFLREPHV